MLNHSSVGQHTLLNGKGLLAAFVGLLLTGQALAETAGRVNFVVGEVSAISSDGSRRVLGKGDLVNSGERLETGKGRLQIRFTDGSFVSLQPNTVFGLDNYTFNKAKPTEGTLLFNFLRGGMRTVSGAIGKVNRNNYRVQTPVATIGIRGTSYAADQEPNGRLLLTVSKGLVNVGNDFGSSNVAVGQTFQTTQGEAPKPAPKGVSVGARASSPEDNADEQKEKAEDKKQELVSNDDKKPDIAFVDQVSENGKPLFESLIIQTRGGVPRLSSFGSLLKGTSGVQIYPNVSAMYDSVSEDGKVLGNLVAITGTETTGGDTNAQTILDTRNGLGSLKFVNVEQWGSLSLGEWTNGTAASVNPYLHEGALSLSSVQFIPYIVGTTAEKNLGNNFKVSYVLVGNTPVRAGVQTGTLNRLNINIDLNLIPLVSIDMGVTLANVGYTAKLTDKPIDVSFDKKLSGFIFTGENDQFFAQSSDNTCANNQCPVNLSAFFSSTDLGVVYEIERLNKTTIGGVAALAGTESVISNSDVGSRLASTLDGAYTAHFSTNTSLATPSQTELAAVFDAPTGKLLSSFHVSNTNGELAVADEYAPVKTLSNNAATTTNVGHFDKVLSWGTWSNGSIVFGKTETSIGNTQALTGNSNVNYLIGLPTAASAIPKTGTVSYSFVGGTTAQTLFTNSNSVSVADAGNISSNSLLSIDFGRATASLNMGMTGFSKGGSLSGIQLNGSTILTADSSNLNFSQLSVTTSSSGATVGCFSCTASAAGGFFGAVNPIGTTGVSAPQAVGLTYKVSGTLTEGQTNTGVSINGAAAFGNAIVPVTGG